MQTIEDRGGLKYPLAGEHKSVWRIKEGWLIELNKPIGKLAWHWMNDNGANWLYEKPEDLFDQLDKGSSF